MSKQELAKEFHKPIIGKFEKQKAHSFFIDNIWGADLPNIQLIRRFNKRLRTLAMNLSHISILNFSGVHYSCIINKKP